MVNSVSKGDVARDLIALGDSAAGKGYGYGYTDDYHGQPLIEVWNDDFHGTKAIYAVEITLRQVWPT